MAALTAALSPPPRMSEPDGIEQRIIGNASVIYLYGYVGVNAAGYVVPLSDAPGITPLGQVVGFGSGSSNAGGAIPDSVTGNTSADVPPTAMVDVFGFNGDFIPVAGASTIADNGSKVYLTSDNWSADLKLTPTTHLPAVGTIVKFHTSSQFKVRFFDVDEMRGSAVSITRWHLGTLAGKALEAVASANVLTFPATKSARILESSWRPTSFEAGITTGTPTLAIRTGGGAVSGGTLTVSGADLTAVTSMSEWHTGSAITNTGGNATVDAGEVITLVRGGGAGLSGLASGNVGIDVYLDVEEL